MCLHKTSPMQVAKKDIPCYKIIEIHHLFDGRIVYQSYYQEARITLGTPIKAAHECTVEELDGIYILTEEVVHAYIEPDIDDGRVFKLRRTTESLAYPFSKSIDIALIECTIPKGTLYCDGTDSLKRPNYGALAIIPNKVIRILTTVEK